MKPARRRRDPEEARGEILDAADRLLAERPPDLVGLADIARGAGVSHALVSHYFGTYVGVVDAVLERRRAAVRARIVARIAKADLVDPDELIEAVFDALSDRTFVRLTLWALGAERPSASETFPLHAQGMRIVADAIAERLGDPGRRPAVASSRPWWSRAARPWATSWRARAGWPRSAASPRRPSTARCAGPSGR